MSQKRQQDDGKGRSDGTSSPDDKRRKTSFQSVVLETMRLHKVQQLLEPLLERLIRKVVKEEVEVALRKHLASMKQNCGKETDPSESRILKLQFVNNISLPVFTGARIEGEECSTVQVALVDCFSGHIVESGPESTAKVEIVVLEGDFDGEEGDDWTLEDFKNNIVRERDGKKPLLTGEVVLNLKDGVAPLGEISFTDNSSWTRSRKFRLGARVSDNFDGTRIREARTESFIVRDHRGELYKKHHPPSLLDEVWRLEKIGKDGAFHKRLSRENINTVNDFLIQLFINPSRLRNILGTGMSAKMWEVTVEHAQTCTLDKRVYLYCPPGSQETGVAFNIVGQVMGLLLEHEYVSVSKLSETQKADGHHLVISAFDHWEEVVLFEDEASLIAASSNFTNVLHTSSSPRAEDLDGSKFLASQKIGGFDYAQPSASSPDIISSIYSVGSTSGLDDYALHNIDGFGLRYDQPLSFPGQVTNSLIFDTDPMAHALFVEDHLQFSDADLQSQNMSSEPQDLHSAVDRFLPSSAVAISDKAQRGWTKLFSVLQWFSIWRIVALRRRVQDIQR
ncbi:calmodulin-binding protein 60 A-like isoform X1 [Pyrus x bretschneideri]|uniref:calmodulin-binding protein 60 A-like isoform X1 n=2 Tax=Pyrus x bretschneideri TaxID=225117 RepID=UPI00202E3B4F|nr:calmodulin-binding protein 60 A-like isoform X1 [Pyrus x bretschneideri]XP_048443789.1 calmodulin-binding protein 60 A-like isoform X1 [Pyrus x bretschneideri]XP_048443790.1 calmodulin-binding protein 60 A-like isoform X1 [Pyrus x bretschneideri]